jgi:hypothetical protein
MGLIDTIEAAYDARPMARERVPEWESPESGEVWVHYKPATQYELDVVGKEVPEGASGSRWNAQVVVLKAMDAEGKRAFSNGDAERLLKKGYSAVLNRLARLMLAVPNPVDVEKK